MSENRPIWNRPAKQPPPGPGGPSWQPPEPSAQPPPGGPGHQPPQPPRRSWPRRHKIVTILLALWVLSIAIVVIALVGSGGNKAGRAAATHPPATSPSPSVSVLNAAEQTFVDDMRSKYDFTSDVKDSDIAQFGQQICSERQAGGSQASEYTTARESWSHTGSQDAYNMTRVAERDLCATYLPAKSWHVIASYSGSGTWNSGQFKLRNQPVRLTYGYSGNSSGFGGDNFIADLVSSSDDLSIANDIAVSGGSRTMLYPDMSFGGSHRYHLEVVATGRWRFKIEQKW